MKRHIKLFEDFSMEEAKSGEKTYVILVDGEVVDRTSNESRIDDAMRNAIMKVYGEEAEATWAEELEEVGEDPSEYGFDPSIDDLIDMGYGADCIEVDLATGDMMEWPYGGKVVDNEKKQVLKALGM